jgi:hypothetical protein
VGSPDASRSNLRTFWDWFLVGAVLGLIYNLFRNPGACACCAGCLVLAVALAAVVVVLFVLEHSLLVAVAILGVFAVWRAWPRIRAGIAK